MSEGFTLVKDGSATQARLKDIIVSNKYPAPKIYTKGNPPHAGDIFLNWQSSISKTFGTTTVLDSFPHGFQYIPTVFASMVFDSGLTHREGTLPFQFGSLAIITIDADITNVNLKYFSIDPGVTVIPAFTMTVRYYVMVEQGS